MPSHVGDPPPLPLLAFPTIVHSRRRRSPEAIDEESASAPVFVLPSREQFSIDGSCQDPIPALSEYEKRQWRSISRLRVLEPHSFQRTEEFWS